MTRIIIDVAEELVSLRIGRTYLPLHGQWVHLYVAMALRLDSGETQSSFLAAHELRLLRPWFCKQPESVGKEVARHLDDLAKRGFEGLIVADGRTKRWRLNVPPRAVLFRPSRQACKTWLSEQQMDVADTVQELPGTLVAWLAHTTRAMVRLVRGEIEEGLSFIQLAKQNHGDSPLLGEIIELVEIRLHSRLKRYPNLGPYLGSGKSDIGKALRMRADLTENLAPTPEPPELEAAIAAVRGIAVRFQNLPDINGLGATHNVLGVLLRRSKRFAEAERCLRYAAVLLVASFDLLTLQGVLFNLGHTLGEVAQTEDALREALQLIELDREIYRQTGIGGDSAQAEIVAGTICLRLNEIEQASRWLEEGDTIVQTLNSDYDKGGLEELRARLLWARCRESSKLEQSTFQAIVGAYENAHRSLSAAGDLPRHLAAEMKALKRGEPPPWSELGWKWKPGDTADDS